MKKHTTAILSAIFLTAAAGAAFCFAEIPTAKAAQEGNSTAISTATSTALVTPNSYQQYLPLKSPASISVATGKKAIADGNAIYFYNEQEDEYTKYEHTANADETKNVITSLQFADDGNLYFLDASTFLYSINPKTFAVEKTNLVCSSFTISGEEIFFVNVSANSQLSKTTLDVLDVSQADLLVGKLGSKPTVAMHGGILYYTNDGKYLHQIHEDTGNTPLVKYFSSEIYSMAFTDSVFAYTDIDGNFRAYSLVDILGGESGLDGVTPLCEDKGSYSALTVYSGAIYAVKGSGIKRFDALENNFTDYEICSQSASINRLSGATDSFLCGDILLTADDGNARISLYDTKTQSYLAPIPYSVSGVKYIAADESTVLIATADRAILFNRTNAAYGETLFEADGFKGNVVGAACVYGSYYLVTDGNQFYRFSESVNESTGEKIWKTNSVSKKTAQTARLLASDAYGCLYVACGNEVYRFDEEEFISPSMAGEKVFNESIPAASTKLLIDYEQTVYALAQNTLYKFGETPAQFDLGKEMVYSQTKETALLSVAFSIEEKTAYLLYDGGLTIKTDELALPTVKTVPLFGADAKIFAEESAQFTVVKTGEKTLTVKFDISALRGAEFFPYLSYGRTQTPLTALKLGNAGDYFVIAVLNDQNAYDTFLVRAKDCEELPPDEYRTDYAEAERRTGYLSNAVHLYKFPYLTDLLTVTRLQKSTKITVLGEIARLDYEYYHVCFTDEKGESKTGYIPKSYVNSFDGEPQSQTQSVVGEQKPADSIFRLAFLVLGFGVICILADFLILRKKND